MISVHEALDLIAATTQRLNAETIALQHAHGRILAAPVFAQLPTPPFDQSAMDGYTIQHATVRGTEGAPIQGEITAGDTATHRLEPGKAYRIFTGAPVPQQADTVIIQERVTVKNGKIFWDDAHCTAGANIRKKGSQIEKGALAAAAGTRLTAGSIGFLASLGSTAVDVFRLPRITILVTGDELVAPGQPLGFGQIYESNGMMLRAALAEGGITPLHVLKVPDQEKATTNAVKEALETSDLVLLTGGISVGDYDFVYTSLQQNEVDTGFYKVRQRPGKPLFFGHKGQTLVFALPGNPASVLTCFYRYVVPAIRFMRGQTFAPNNTATLPLSEDFTKKMELTYFCKAVCQNDLVQIVQGQESYKLNAFTQADHLAEFPEGIAHVPAGQHITVHNLNTCWV